MSYMLRRSEGGENARKRWRKPGRDEAATEGYTKVAQTHLGLLQNLESLLVAVGIIVRRPALRIEPAQIRWNQHEAVGLRRVRPNEW